MRSVNQNRHLYVVTDTGTVTEASATGVIEARVSGANPLEKDLYFLYKGRDGVTRSDMIPLNQITYVKYASAANQETPLRRIEVSLNDDPVVGKDYIMNISFQQFYGLSNEDTYVKTIALHAGPDVTNASSFIDAMIDELNASFSREVGATATSNPYLSFTKSGSKLVIEEKEQPWTLGKWEAESLMFDVFLSTIIVDGAEVEWGTVDVVTPVNFVSNSKRMADLEWFTFGERADYYRGMGYPNDFPFRPLVNPDEADGYDALEIHFAYQGTCEDIQKSEKDITLIGTATSEVITDLMDSLAELGVPGVESSSSGSDDEP